MQPRLRTPEKFFRNALPDTQCVRIPKPAHIRADYFSIVQGNAQLAKVLKGDCMRKGVLRVVLGTACAATLGVSCLALTGCSGAHQVIGYGESCSSCHSDSKSTYEVSSPKDAVTCNGQITVKTSASSVVVCKPTFISEDGSSYVPEQSKTVNVSGGQASLQLDAGTWALVVADGDNVKSSKLIVVDPSSASADVDL